MHISLVPVPLNTRQITSSFRRSDRVVSGEERSAREHLLPDLEKEGSDVIVIHAGSRHTRIGFANDALPKVLMTCISLKSKKTDTSSTELFQLPALLSVDFEAQRKIVEGLEEENSKEMLSYLPKKLVPNSKQQIYNFNRAVKGQKIAGHNDAFGLEYTTISPDVKYVIGVEALRIEEKELFSAPKFPIQKRLVQLQNYNCDSPYEVLGDLRMFIEMACEKELSLQRKYLKDYSIVIILPDSYHRLHVKAWFQVIQELGFKSSLFIHVSIILCVR